MTLCRGIERIAAQPTLVFAIESVYVLTLFVPAALTGAAEKIEPSGVERAVIRLRRVAAEGNGIDFLAREETVGNKLLKVDEIRVPGKGRVGLVRRVAVAGRAERQDLPVLLSGFPEEIGKLSRLSAQRSDAVRRRERCDMQNNSACSHGKRLFRLLEFADAVNFYGCCPSFRACTAQGHAARPSRFRSCRAARRSSFPP